tara:strand:- start:2425 stop:2601 length:177 start_codon:yes stop_codon:yes gene_type:complete
MSRFRNQTKKIKSKKTNKSQMVRKNMDNVCKNWDDASIDSRIWVVEEIINQLQSKKNK